MQIKLSGEIFIKYSDFHIPFHDDDLFDMELLINHNDFAVYSHGYGAGMEELIGNEEGLEFIVEHSTPTDEPEDAAYGLSTLLIAKEGETISGDVIADAMKEAKETNKTMASVIREKLKNTNVNLTTIVSAGEGVPQTQQRQGGRKKKSTQY